MNQLTRLQDFRTVLADYAPSDQAKSLLQNIELALLVGPSSCGRNTIINELTTSGRYHYIISDTTRQPRTNNGIVEQNGREYWFRAEADMLHDLQTGLFLEAAVIHNQQVSGMSIRELTTAAEEGRTAINEIEVVGADNVHAIKQDTAFIFVVPPSFNEWMARMQNRGELPDEETDRRLASAVQEITAGLKRNYYHFIVNDTFKDAALLVDAIIANRAPAAEQQAEARQVAQRLLDDTRAHLANR